MSETGHDLHSEFPDDGAILHELKLADPHFRTVADRYHDLAREIGRIEGGIDAASDERLEGLKKQRLAMLDEVAALIAMRKTAA